MLTKRESSGEPGFDAGGIWIRRARKLTPAALAEEVTRYWVARGAKRADEPAALGIAIVDDDPWLYVADSSRFHADLGLAKHLAETLATRVIWYTVANTIGAAALRILGPGQAVNPPRDTYDGVVDFLDRRTLRCWDYATLDETFSEVLHLHFAEVPREMGDPGPALRPNR